MGADQREGVDPKVPRISREKNWIVTKKTGKKKDTCCRVGYFTWTVMLKRKKNPIKTGPGQNHLEGRKHISALRAWARCRGLTPRVVERRAAEKRKRVLGGPYAEE